jgi:hypothetical protein
MQPVYKIPNLINALDGIAKELKVEGECTVHSSLGYDPNYGFFLLANVFGEKEDSNELIHTVARWARDFVKKVDSQDSINVTKKIGIVKTNYADIHNQLEKALEDPNSIPIQDLIKLRDSLDNIAKVNDTYFSKKIAVISKNQSIELQLAENELVNQIYKFYEELDKIETILRPMLENEIKDFELVEKGPIDILADRVLAQSQNNLELPATKEQIALIIDFVKNKFDILTAGTIGKKTSMPDTFKFKAALHNIPFNLLWKTKPRDAGDIIVDISFLGKGTYKIVRKALLLNELNSLAISKQRLGPPTAGDTTLKTYAKREVDILNKLKGRPHVLQIYSCTRYLSIKKGEVIQALMTQLCNMGELEDHLETLSEKERFQVACGILKGVLEVHIAGVLHRDLKAANIFLKKIVNQQGEEEIYAVVSDFGLSCYAENDSSIRDRAGTLFYSAPEVLLKQPASYRSDAWSVGIMLHELFYKKLPYSEHVTVNTIYTEMEQYIFNKPEPIDKQSVDYVIWKLLREDRMQRMTIPEAIQIIQEQSAKRFTPIPF